MPLEAPVMNTFTRLPQRRGTALFDTNRTKAGASGLEVSGRGTGCGGARSLHALAPGMAKGVTRAEPHPVVQPALGAEGPGAVERGQHARAPGMAKGVTRAEPHPALPPRALAPRMLRTRDRQRSPGQR